MTKFVLGELAVLQNASYFAEWEGALAVVVGDLTVRDSRNMHTMGHECRLGYVVRPLVEGAFDVNCQPYQLRKLDEPCMEELVEERCDLEIPSPAKN